MSQASIDALITAAANDGAVTLVFIVAIGAMVYLSLKVFLPLIKILQELYAFMVRLNGRLTQATIDHVAEGERRRAEDLLLEEEAKVLREKKHKEAVAKLREQGRK